MYYGVLGVHDNGFSKVVSGWKAVDMLSDGNTGSGHAPNRLLAATEGTIGYICRDDLSVAIRMGDFFYTHLLDNNNLKTGNYFSAGAELGQLKTGSFNDDCGRASQGDKWFHVHWGFADQNAISVDGWTLNLSDGIWRSGDKQIGTGGWISASSGSPPPAPSCPTSVNSGVIFYREWQYGCGGFGENVGYLRRENTGAQNMPNDLNDEASSVRIASGWSVKVYENSGQGGGARCYTSSDNKFDGDNFNNGKGVDGRITSFAVFHDTRCGEPEPPCPAPALNAPSNGASFETGTVAFSWNDVSCNKSGFTFRVRTGPDMDRGGDIVVSTTNNGTSRTQTISENWHYKDLYWSVKAANAPGGAAWASSRRFHISPNRLPTVVLDSANGDGRDEILTTEQNWSFTGRANDPEGQLRRVEFHCKGDGCNDNDSFGTLTSFTYQRNGLSGRNQVWFTACDDRQCVDSRKVTLLIDREPPTAEAAFNNLLPGALPAWFNTAVNVTISARDGGTGGAPGSVREVWYRLDGGGWQQRSGASASFDGGGDGSHTVEYYAVDHVGNRSSTRSHSYRIDRTPPNPVGGVGESNGVANGLWQKAQSTPTFTWAASSDSGSGLWGYQFYFGTDANGVGFQSFEAAADRRWTPQPGGVRTGTYYLRGRSRDNAGNYSDWATLFVYRYDGTPPENPTEATHAASVANDTWQRTTSVPNFTWPAPNDEGSGIKGYAVYWGDNANGEAATFSATPGFQSTTPLCGTGATCTGYLRVRSLDNVDNQATKWSTTFVLRYDGAPPTVDFTFNGGVTRTAQTSIVINLQAADQGSGVNAMRFSSDGVQWTTWEAFAPDRPWTIPAIGRQSWPVYVQVRDRVGWESAVMMQEVYFEVNAEQPRSEGFRLFDYTMSAGSGAHASATFQGRSTVGQTLDSARTGSANFRLVGGYEAGSQAIPLAIPGHDEFTFVNGIFASGIVVDTMRSPGFQMLATVGEVGLPNNTTTIASASYRHQPGFLAAAPSVAATPTPSPTPEPTPGPTPEPEPTPACEFPTVSIDNGALFTGQVTVTLSLCAPRAAEMILSNDGGFGGAQWEPFKTQKSWTIAAAGNYVVPRFVYAAFKDANGAIQSIYFDDIILDPESPTGSILVGDSIPAQAALRAGRSANELAALTTFNVGGVTYVQQLHGRRFDAPLMLARADGEPVDLYINAVDGNSGVAAMQVSEDPNFINAVWEPYSALKPWVPQGGDGVKTLYVRFRDAAGNISEMTSASFALDTEGPLGGLGFGDSVGGPMRTGSTLFLGAEDNLTAVAAMRISEQADFSDAVWEPYNTTVPWSFARRDAGEGQVYAQYRDLAGNVSEVYYTPYLIDLGAPDIYAEAAESTTPTRTLTVYVWDELSQVTTVRMSNDPLFIEGVIEATYAETMTWVFDDRNLVWMQAQDGVGNWSEPYPAAVPSQLAYHAMTVSPGWNFISSNVEPVNPALVEALSSIAGLYNRVWTDGAFFSTDVEPQFNTLTEIHGASGYYLRLTGSGPAALQLAGQRLLVDTPLNLQAGWNMIGYLPNQPLPVAEALQSIAGQYGLVLSIDKTYDPLQPEFSTLATLEPGQGYLIWMTAPGVLVYPDAGAADAQAIKQSVSSGCAVSPTPQFTLVYGIVQINGAPAPAGTVVQATNAAGQVTGCGVVGEAGRLGYTHVFGVQDEGDVGMAPGELITWRVTGIDAQAAPALAWQNDRSGHRLDIGVTVIQAYLPIIGKQ